MEKPFNEIIYLILHQYADYPPLISAPNFICDESAATGAGGRFPRALPQPIEQRRVRFAVFLRTLQKFRHPAAKRYAFLAQRPFFVTTFAGVAAFHSNQLVLLLLIGLLLN
ncbi:hypothetical protein AB1K83_14520 [Sporosarcina sp. 179-K 3D1 HS]|uniref:hypothetical protein n=1 Tax=Sporosarcina sp. 179-K 3D1 HS TaxID=3232169 RepID=UPI0039A113F6